MRNPKDKSQFLDIPCGKCFACLKRKRQEWIIRLTEESRCSYSMFFVTLTYDDSNVPVCINDYNVTYLTLNKKHFNTFFRELRRSFRHNFIDANGNVKSVPYKCKYYAIGEYGSKTYRPHYHFLLFFEDDIVSKQELQSHLEHFWSKGFACIGDVTEASIAYVTKYCITKPSNTVNRLVSFGCQKPFMVCSKGLGINYFIYSKSLHNYVGQTTYYDNHGRPHLLPRYYKLKFFGDSKAAPFRYDLESQNEWLSYLFDTDRVKDNIRVFNKSLIKNEKI